MDQGFEQFIAVNIEGHNDVTASINDARQSIKSLRHTAEATANAINNLEPDDIDMSAIRQASATLNDMGRSLAIVGGLMTGAMGMAVRESALLDDSLANLASVSTVPIDGSVADLSEGLELSKQVAIDWSANHVQAASEVTTSMYDLASAGLNMVEVNNTVAQTMTMASATKADGAVASAMMAKALGTFGQAQLANMSINERATVIMDTYAAVVKGAKTTLPDLGAGLKAVQGVAANAGLTIQETAATIGLLQTRGLEASTSGTYLAGMLKNLPKAADKLGLSIADVNGKLLPMNQIIAQLTDRYAEGGLSVKEMSEIQVVFGDEAGKAVQLLIGQETALQNLTAAANSTGAAMGMVALQEDSLAAQGRILWNNVHNLGTVFGDGLTPVLRPIARYATVGVQAMQKFATAHPILSSIATTAIALSAAILLIGGAALMIAGQLLTASVTVGPYLNVVKNYAAGVLTSLSSTGTRALAIMSSGASSIYSSLTASVMSMHSTMSMSVTAAAQSMRASLVGMMTNARITILLTASNIKTSVISAATTMRTQMMLAGSSMKTSIVSAMTAIKGASIGSVMGGIKGVLVSAASAIAGGFTAIAGAASAAWAAITGPIGLIVLAIAALVGIGYWLVSSMEGQGSIIGRVWTTIKETFMSVYDQIAYGVGYMVGIFDVAWGEISKFTEEVWPYISKVINAVMLAIKVYTLPIAALIKTVFVTTWGIIKTATVFVWEVIKGTIIGAVRVIYHVIAAIWTAISGVFKVGMQLVTGDWSGAWETIKETITGVWGHIKGVFGAVWGWLAGLASSFANAGRGLLNAFLDGIMAGWKTLKNGFFSIVETIRSYLPGSDARQGPLSDLTASGQALPETFATGISEMADSPVIAMHKSIQQTAELIQFPVQNIQQNMSSSFDMGEGNGSDESAPVISPVFGDSGVVQASQSQTASSGNKIVFESGAIQLTIHTSDGQISESIDNLEDQLEDVFRNAVEKLGVANG